jgi:hypothetical protein
MRHGEREKRMLDTAKQVADFAYKQGVGDAVAVDHLIREYRATAEQLRGAVAIIRELVRVNDSPDGAIGDVRAALGDEAAEQLRAILGGQ